MITAIKRLFTDEPAPDPAVPEVPFDQAAREAQRKLDHVAAQVSHMDARLQSARARVAELEKQSAEALAAGREHDANALAQARAAVDQAIADLALARRALEVANENIRKARAETIPALKAWDAEQLAEMESEAQAVRVAIEPLEARLAARLAEALRRRSSIRAVDYNVAACDFEQHARYLLAALGELRKVCDRAEAAIASLKPRLTRDADPKPAVSQPEDRGFAIIDPEILRAAAETESERDERLTAEISW